MSEGFRKKARTDPAGTASCFEPLEPAGRFFVRTYGESVKMQVRSQVKCYPASHGDFRRIFL
jgi:hypothetical protein